MTEGEKILARQLYDRDDARLLAQRHRVRGLVRDYNSTDSADTLKENQILNGLLGGRGEVLWITASFFMDYGNGIYFGNNCEVNMNCIPLDDNVTRVGNNIFAAPNMQIHAAFYPTNAMGRFGVPQQGGFLTFCRTQTAPVAIGDNVQIDGGAIIMSGVTIDDNVVIGVGSVVTKDIPSDIVAHGNPCRVRRENRQSSA